jgi:hypothetical protein
LPELCWWQRRAGRWRFDFSPPGTPKTNILGLNKVIAFTYSPTKNFDLKQLHSVTLVGPVGAGDWKYWQARKGGDRQSAIRGIDLLRSPIDKAVDNLTGQDLWRKSAAGNRHDR